MKTQFRAPRYVEILLVYFFVFLFFGGIEASCGQTPDGKPYEDYNIVLIIIDTLRPDHLGCYGYSKNISENIDEVAERSFVFENAFSQAGYTFASHTSIFTSLYPVAHGVYHIYKDKLSSRVQTLPEILGIYGYKTAWFALLSDAHLDLDSGFGRGFQDRVELDSVFNGRDQLLSWVEKNKGNKFFLALNTPRVHDYFKFENDRNGFFREIDKDFYKKLLKYVRNNRSCLKDPAIFSTDKELFNGRYGENKGERIMGLVRQEKFFEVRSLRSPSFQFFVTKEMKKNAEFWIASYDACIQAVDQELIKPLVEKLKESGLYDKTILVITADHGEAFGGRGLYGHGPWVYDEYIRVPLIIKIPRVKNGRKIKELAQSIDIMPTVLELAGIKEPHQTQGKSLAGLMNLLDTLPPHEYIFANSSDYKLIRSCEWSFIAARRRKELYHLKSDPKEQDNLYHKEQAVAQELETKLKAWEASLPSYKDKEYNFPPEIDKETQERIQKTGYW